MDVVLRAVAMPIHPTSGIGETRPLGRAEMVGNKSGLSGTGSGAADITLSKGTPGVATTSNPNSATVVPGTSVTDR